MAELEGKVPQSRWYVSTHNFTNSGNFYKSFGTRLKKGLVYFYTKKILPLLLYF